MDMQEKLYEMNEQQLDEITGGIGIVYYDHQTKSWKKEWKNPLKKFKHFGIIDALARKAI